MCSISLMSDDGTAVPSGIGRREQLHLLLPTPTALAGAGPTRRRVSPGPGQMRSLPQTAMMEGVPLW
jgi:hypothetical protein